MCVGDNTYYGTVSQQLDDLSSTLMGNALDMLAEGEYIGVLVVIQREDNTYDSMQLSNDGIEAMLEAARERVRKARGALRYAIAYEGAIEDERGGYADALIVEFGERGRPSFSAYSLFEGRGRGNGFVWTDPAPAGEEEPLL